VKAIPRGIIYIDFITHVKSFLKVLYIRLDDKNIIQRFEKKLAEHVGTEYCLCFPMARTALHAILKILDFQKNAQIIASPLTIRPIIQVIEHSQLEPVVVDIERNTLCYDIEQLKSQINENTKAILITYLYGITPNIKEIIAIAKNHGLFVIEDFSHNFNAQYDGKNLGTFGDVAIYSSSFTKTFDLFGGGLIFTDNSSLYEQLKIQQEEMSNNPRLSLVAKILKSFIIKVVISKTMFSSLTIHGLRGLSYVQQKLCLISGKYKKKQKRLKRIPSGWKTYFTSLQARLGIERLEQVQKLDKSRIKIFHTMKGKIVAPHLKFPVILSEVHNVYWQMLIFCHDPKKLKRWLLTRRIDSASTKLCLSVNTPELIEKEMKSPNAEYLKNHSLFIPLNPELKGEDIDNIITAVNNFQN